MTTMALFQRVCMVLCPEKTPEILKFSYKLFRSTSKSRPNNIRGGIMSVRPSVRPQSFFDFNEIWYIGRGR